MDTSSMDWRITPNGKAYLLEFYDGILLRDRWYIYFDGKRLNSIEGFLNHQSVFTIPNLLEMANAPAPPLMMKCLPLYINPVSLLTEFLRCPKMPRPYLLLTMCLNGL
jgi:hypothetical protein